MVLWAFSRRTLLWQLGMLAVRLGPGAEACYEVNYHAMGWSVFATWGLPVLHFLVNSMNVPLAR